jgi:3-dehydroquinate synthase
MKKNNTQIAFAGQEQLVMDALANKQIVVIADARSNGFCVPVASQYVPALQNAHILAMPAGEDYKTAETAQWLWSQLQQMHINKSWMIVNIGGGVVCDIGGFVASTYMRGIPFINIPTTLLAMNDAAIGGKTGINFGGIKNSIGSFANAQMVYVQPAFLNTLPDVQICNGAMESIKHALIYDAALWQQFCNHPSINSFTNLASIKQSIAIKNHFVQIDPLDENKRQALNFGHTIGHAIEAESLQSNNPLLHGQAILLGMLAELWISEKTFHLSSSVRQDLEKIHQQLMPAVQFTFDANKIVQHILHDKKNTDTTRMSLLCNIAEPKIKTQVSSAQILEALNYLTINH